MAVERNEELNNVVTEESEESSVDEVEGEVRRRRPSKTRRFVRRVKAFTMRSQGYSAGSAKRWTKKVNRVYRANDDVARSVKAAAIKQGNVPNNASLLEEAGKTNQISEKEYLYLHPMNGKYDKWIKDRVSALNVFSGFASDFETCYFHIIRRNGHPFFISMNAETKEVAPDYEGLYAWLASREPVKLSGSTWTKSFAWDLSAGVSEEGGKAFFVNGKAFLPENFEAWLNVLSKKRSMVIFDPAEESDFWNDLAPQAEGKLKVRLLNKDGNTPSVVQAYIQLEYKRADWRFLSADDEDEMDEDFAEDPSESEPAFMQEDEELEAESVETAEGEVKEYRFPVAARARKYRRKRRFSAVDVATGAFSGVRYSSEGKLQQFDAAMGATVPFAGTVPHWAEIKAALEGMCRFVPQLEFAEFELNVTAEGFAIIAIRSLPAYNAVVPFPDQLNEFFIRKAQAKHESFAGVGTQWSKFTHNASRRIRKYFASAVALRGLVPYQSTRWIGDMKRDFFSKNGMSASEKIWAYKHGFLSYRVPQYGITPDNWENVISDFEYRWLRHINTKYKYWLEDKITLKYIASDFKECFPDYYYYTSLSDGENRVVPMMDIPEGYGATFEDVIRLAKSIGVLALKPDEGSHGQGFYKLEYKEDQFFLNGQEATEEEVCGILENPENQYIVTEYIQMHPQLKEIYPDSVNTIRVTVFKKDGRTPEIGNVYMRIGSSRTGFVDNVAAGGIVASVDIETGKYGNPQILDGINQGNLIPCPNHPDTGIKIEGVLPNWEYAKEKILGIAASIAQLEYFGFDLAITPDGIKLPEINRFPDFPRIDTLEPQLIDYLLYKLDRKKRVFHYDVVPCKKLLTLPKRGGTK